MATQKAARLGELLQRYRKAHSEHSQSEPETKSQVEVEEETELWMLSMWDEKTE